MDKRPIQVDSTAYTMHDASFGDSALSDPIVRFLLNCRYPDEQEYQTGDKSAPFYIPRKRFKELDQEIDAYEKMLRHLEPEFLKELHDRELERVGSVQARLQIKAIQRFKFEDEKSLADFDYWLQAERWSIEEGAALALGLDPEVIDLRVARSRQRKVDMARRYCRLHDLADRHFAELPKGARTTSAKFAAWALNVGCVESFRDAVAKITQVSQERLEGKLARLRSENEELKLKSDRRRSMMRLILALAIDKFKYDPAKQHGSAVTNMSSATDRHGLSVSDDTVRSILTEASEQFGEEVRQAKA